MARVMPGSQFAGPLHASIPRNSDTIKDLIGLLTYDISNAMLEPSDPPLRRWFIVPSNGATAAGPMLSPNGQPYVVTPNTIAPVYVWPIVLLSNNRLITIAKVPVLRPTELNLRVVSLELNATLPSTFFANANAWFHAGKSKQFYGTHTLAAARKYNLITLGAVLFM